MPIKENDTVWAADGGKVYESKVVKVQDVGGSKKYFIHYNGWARKFDKWVDEVMVAPFGDPKKEEALRRFSKELLLNPSVRKPAAGSKKEETTGVSDSSELNTSDPAEPTATQTATPAPSATRSSKKGKVENSEDALIKEAVKRRKELLQQDLVEDEHDHYSSKLPIPQLLKKQLVDEWSVITHEPRRLLLIPRQQSVSTLLSDFLAFKRKALSRNAELIDRYISLFSGLKNQFNKALFSILLYRQELQQYEALHDKCVGSPTNGLHNAADYYGTEHLLRFYTRLPKLLTNAVMPPAEIGRILAMLAELLTFIVKNSHKYLNMSHYVLVPDAMDYLAKWSDRSATHLTGGNGEQETTASATPALTAVEAKGVCESSIGRGSDQIQPLEGEEVGEGVGGVEKQEMMEEEEAEGAEESSVEETNKSQTARSHKRKRSGTGAARKPKRR